MAVDYPGVGTVTDTTDRVYTTSVPGFMRQADGQQTPVRPLLRYLAGVADILGNLDALVSRIQYVPSDEGGEAGDTSDLVDPVAADNRWLDWLAQLVGVQLAPKLTEAERRDAVTYASSGWRAATKTAVADAAKTVLTGTKYATVYDHATTRSNAGTQSMWDVLIVTKPDETPDPAQVLATVVAKGAKPAGVTLHHEPYAATWATLATVRPTWADWHLAGSWAALEQTV